MAMNKLEKHSAPQNLKPSEKFKANQQDKHNERILEKMAIEEIMRETKLKSIRANEIGPTGWLDIPVKRTNKRFLNNTIKAVVKHNNRKEDRVKLQSEKKLLELDYKKHPSRRPKFGDRKFVFKKPSVDAESKNKAKSPS